MKRAPEQRKPILENQIQQWKEIGAQSQRVITKFIQRQQADNGFSIIKPYSIGQAFLDMTSKIMSDPHNLMTAQQRLWLDSIKLWYYTARRAWGLSSLPALNPDPGDRRFAAAPWQEELTFDYIKQSYVLASQWLMSLVSDVKGLSPDEKEKVNFYTRQFVSAVSPSNFAALNPVIMKKIQETNGQNLVDGLRHMLDDMEQGQGELKISMTVKDAFKVGENVATTPGKVIYQNDLMQLIQYNPTTQHVYKRPLLIVPPWINKFYVLDLQPKNSFIRWIVDQGYTLFIISWVNPRKDLAYKSFDDYMLEGPLAALDQIKNATGETSVNILGFCIGGILVEALLAWMSARGDSRIKSATLLATMLDFRNVGEVSVFIDDEMIESLENHVKEKGYLEGRHMALMFSMMRENDLIWSFVVNNYLMGRDPVPFDLLYWNSDSTRLPATMLLYYLKNIYQENGLIKPGYLKINGEKIDVRKIKTPTYVLATKEDHIAPWVSCYPVTQMFSGEVRFVLGGSGHIAGIINPPSAGKYNYRTYSKYPSDPMVWFEKSKEHPGSWWQDWNKWLLKKSGGMVNPRRPGEGKLAPLEDAPGSYVKVIAVD